MKNSKIDNAVWLRERASGIQRGVRPETEKDWFAFATGLEMVADYCDLTKKFMLDVLTDEGAIQ